MKQVLSLRVRMQSGQSMVEALVLCVIVTALVAMPVSGERSVLELMLHAIRTAFAKFLAALSLPL